MQRAPPNPTEASHATTIEDVGNNAGPVTLLVFNEDCDSRVVVDGDGETWEFAINDEIAHSRCDISQLPEWIEPVLTSIGIRTVRTDQEDV